MNRLASQWLWALGGAAVMLAWVFWPRATAGCASDTTITVAGGQDVSAGQQRRDLIAKWRGPNRERAEYRELSPIADLQHSQLAAAAQAGSCEYDVYILDVERIPRFAKANHIVPIKSGTIEADRFLDNPLTSGRYRGELWAVPFNTDVGLLFYRKDLLSKAGLQPPATWQELWDQAGTLLADPANQLSSGYSPQLAGYEGLTVNALELIWAAGGDLVAPDGSVSVDRPAARQAIQRLVNALRGDPPLISGSAVDQHEAEAIQAFESGKVAFMRNWPYAYGVLAGSDIAGKFGVTRLPGPSVLGGQSLAIAATSPQQDQEAARDLIRHLTNEQSQRQLFTCGGFAPVRVEVYANPGTCLAGENPQNERVEHHLPDVKMLEQAVHAARPRPTSPYYAELSETLFTRLNSRLRCLDPALPCDEPSGINEFAASLADDLRAAAEGR